MRAQIAVLQAAEILAKKERTAMASDIRSILIILAEAKGGWKTLVVAGTAIAALASAATAFFAKIGL